MSLAVADLCDQFAGQLQIADDVLRPFGGCRRVAGVIETVRIDEDNRPVIALLEQSGNGRILVVDNRGLRHCAVAGDRLAGLARKNGWAGIIINGCVRDTETLVGLEIGIWAIGTCPIRSAKKTDGETGAPVSFANVTFRSGEYLYADADGIVVSAKPLTEDFGSEPAGLLPVVNTPDAPQPNGHYVQAIKHGGLIFVSMQLPINPEKPGAPPPDFERQTEQVIDNVAAILKAAGSDLQKTLRVTIYVADMGLWSKANAIFAERFGDHKPARGVVAVSSLHLGYQIAMDVIAAADHD